MREIIYKKEKSTTVFSRM